MKIHFLLILLVALPLTQSFGGGWTGSGGEEMSWNQILSDYSLNPDFPVFHTKKNIPLEISEVCQGEDGRFYSREEKKVCYSRSTINNIFFECEDERYEILEFSPISTQVICNEWGNDCRTVARERKSHHKINVYNRNGLDNFINLAFTKTYVIEKCQ